MLRVLMRQWVVRVLFGLVLLFTFAVPAVEWLTGMHLVEVTLGPNAADWIGVLLPSVLGALWWGLLRRTLLETLSWAAPLAAASALLSFWLSPVLSPELMTVLWIVVVLLPLLLLTMSPRAARWWLANVLRERSPWHVGTLDEAERDFDDALWDIEIETQEAHERYERSRDDARLYEAYMERLRRLEELRAPTREWATVLEAVLAHARAVVDYMTAPEEPGDEALNELGDLYAAFRGQWEDVRRQRGRPWRPLEGWLFECCVASRE